jgi:D-glycero-beta-D-manno-heptose-7-phosphate kinase
MAALTPARARALADAFSGARILVVGDVMLDQFLIGQVSRISPEAPVPIVQFNREEHRIGGAANVAHNIVALGGQVDLVGLVGRDAAAASLRRALEAAGIGISGLVHDAARPTTTKVRVVTDRHQQVARVDYERDDEVAGAAGEALVQAVTRLAAGAGALVISDYLKGAVTPAVVAALARMAAVRDVPLLVDPKIPHIDYYAGATLITPNHHEAEIATHLRIRTDEEAGRAARAFRDLAKSRGVLVTRGEHGMWLLDGDEEGAFGATAREVADVTGAGDTVIATLALALAAGATTAEAAELSNHAAGIVVGKFGPATATLAELLGALDSADAAGRQRR